MTFGYVPAPYGHALWAQVATLLGPAVRRSKADWGELLDDLASARAQLWLTTDNGRPVAAMVTILDGDTLLVWLAGGAVLSGSVPFLETALKAAKAGGAVKGRIDGRKGWERVLRPYGWQRQGDELVKELA